MGCWSFCFFSLQVLTCHYNYRMSINIARLSEQNGGRRDVPGPDRYRGAFGWAHKRWRPTRMVTSTRSQTTDLCFTVRKVLALVGLEGFAPAPPQLCCSLRPSLERPPSYSKTWEDWGHEPRHVSGVWCVYPRPPAHLYTTTVRATVSSAPPQTTTKRLFLSRALSCMQELARLGDVGRLPRRRCARTWRGGGRPDVHRQRGRVVSALDIWR